MPKKQHVIELSAIDRLELEAIVRSGQHKARTIRRAQTLLWSDAGKTDTEIAELHGITALTVAQTQAVFATHLDTYNHVRPHQGTACGNRPPYVAFPQLSRLPAIPARVDPDHWLLSYHQHVFKRRVTHNGSIQVDKHRYYIRRELAGRYVVLQLDAHRRVFDVWLTDIFLKTMPIKGLYDQPCEFGLYLEMMVQDAEAEWRRLQRNQQRRAA